jgi:AcrR family transcriptional regulator
MHVTQGALFRHFTNKDAIWAAVMEWVADRLLGHVDRAAARATGPIAALEAMFLAHVDFVARHAGVPRILFGELQRAEETPAKRMVQTIIARYRERLVVLLEQGKATGECAPDLDCAAAATLFIGTIQGLVMSSMLAGDVERVRRDAPGAFAILRRGLGVRP